MDEPDFNGLQHEIVFDSKNNNEERKPWEIFGHKVSRSALLFLFQCLLILILIVTSVICLALSQSCEETTVWIAVLSSAVCYCLPNPKVN